MFFQIHLHIRIETCFQPDVVMLLSFGIISELTADTFCLCK